MLYHPRRIPRITLLMSVVMIVSVRNWQICLQWIAFTFSDDTWFPAFLGLTEKLMTDSRKGSRETWR